MECTRWLYVFLRTHDNSIVVMQKRRRTNDVGIAGLFASDPRMFIAKFIHKSIVSGHLSLSPLITILERYNFTYHERNGTLIVVGHLHTRKGSEPHEWWRTVHSMAF